MPHAHPTSLRELDRIAIEAMTERGLEPEFSPLVLQELERMSAQQAPPQADIKDLTNLPWCSIDNDDSLDLDQLTASERLADGYTRVWVAIADVDALVHKDSAIDAHACINTTSVYSSTRVFPMLPVQLSTDRTSLNLGQERLALVTEMRIAPNGTVQDATLYRARVKNQAKLAYDALSDWLEGRADVPEAARAVPGMAEQVRTQDAVAQSMRALRRTHGSLEFETFQPKAVIQGDQIVDIRQQVHNRARQLIEELMIATNTCTARYLARRGGASLRRVVRSPERWLRIVEVARKYGSVLPPTPDAKALEAFLAARHSADPQLFPDLSLVIVKLMGSGEYVVEQPSGEALGHFGLAERDYTHSTAPNRRYPDLITLRMVKAMLDGTPSPYTLSELQQLAIHCTHQEDAARKVERRIRKSEAALLLESRVGQEFDAFVTGLSPSATWIRIFSPPAEGRLIDQSTALVVGQAIRVKLVDTNVAMGFIDFAQVHPSR